MSQVFITCPKTTKTLLTPFEDSPGELQKHWDKHATIKCPHCGETHSFVVREAFVAGVLSDQGLSSRGISDLIKELEPKATKAKPALSSTKAKSRSERTKR